MPRKTIVEEFESGTPVSTGKTGGYAAFAAFEMSGNSYASGDVFSIPQGWTRDNAFDEFRGTEKKNRTMLGIAFNVPGEILDKKTGERAYTRQVLPVSEA